MRCPSCNSDNQPTARFCVECGTAFRTSCAKCGFENPPAAKFCQECGASFKPGATPQPFQVAALTSLRNPAVYEGPSAGSVDVPDGERKTVTALFADIKGSTELEQDLDPEDARVIVDPALKLMIDTVDRYDGISCNPPATASLRCSARAGRTRGSFMRPRGSINEGR